MRVTTPDIQLTISNQRSFIEVRNPRRVCLPSRKVRRKVTPRKKVEQTNPSPIETKPEKPKRTQAASAAPASSNKPSSGFSFGGYLIIAIILFAVWVAYRDSMSKSPPTTPKPKPSSKAAKPSKTKPNKKRGGDILVLSDNTTQCQASTAKGTRCTRDNNLQLKRHVVNKRNCQFTVCKQHDSKSFKPHPSVLKGL